MKGQPINKNLLKRLYQKHLNGDMVSDLARENGIRPATLYYALRKIGPVNRGFRLTEGKFSKLWPITTPVAAYIYGLWLADGCYDGKTIQIKLHQEDSYLLYRIAKYLQCNDPYNDGSARKIIFNPGRFVSVPEEFFPRRKSYCTMPYPILPAHLYSHFIRGVFDGDGSIGSRKHRPRQIQLYICCTDKCFLESLQSSILTGCGANSIIYTETRDHFGYQDMHTLRIGTQDSQVKFFRWIYKRSGSFKMERKYQIFANHVNTVLTGRSGRQRRA